MSFDELRMDVEKSLEAELNGDAVTVTLSGRVRWFIFHKLRAPA